MQRAQKQLILEDLEKKMVFLSGPRQVGKTWLCKEIMKEFKMPLYLNYDNLKDVQIIQNGNWDTSTDLIVFDELHKMEKWKNYLKGLFDTKKPELSILVTGSARLETFRQAGDSLAGRFFMHRLLPFSPKETSMAGEEIGIKHFMKRGGFPEALLAETDEEADRWRQQYTDGLIRDDILSFETIHELNSIKLILQLLKKRVGSPLSYSSIARDVQLSSPTVKHYIDILEALYIVFRVYPFSRNIARSLLKEPKIYFFDVGMVKDDPGARFENLMALCLLKHVYGLQDQKGIRAELNYLRTKEGKEVDFCVVENEEVTQMVEAKYNDRNIDKNLFYFHKKYGLPGVQVTVDPRYEMQEKGVGLRDAKRFLEGLVV